ncbi:MAG: TonB-dependent receptor [Desulfofustis sp.]|nr:TonB-dependent receptor [Desulfofustis sp.]
MTPKTSFMAVVITLMACSLPITAAGQSKPESPPPMQGPAGWSYFTRGGAVYQFDADIEDDATFNVTRFNLEVGAGYRWNRQDSVGLALGYTYNGYSFSSGKEPGPFADKPWDDIHSLSLGVPMRYGLNSDWSTFFIPSVRFTGDGDADVGDTMTGGLLGGFAYRFGDRLTIGPGIGVFSQLEESATVIPILIVDWKITDKLSLETGRGQAATLGPGLTLNYRANERWSVAVGGRYEKLRFRLDSNGGNPDGIGEDSSFPLFASVTHRFNPKSSLSLVGGVELGGELRQEDEDGNRIASENYDAAPFLGLTFGVSF